MNSENKDVSIESIAEKWVELVLAHLQANTKQETSVIANKEKDD